MSEYWAIKDPAVQQALTNAGKKAVSDALKVREKILIEREGVLVWLHRDGHMSPYEK